MSSSLGLFNYSIDSSKLSETFFGENHSSNQLLIVQLKKKTECEGKEWNVQNYWYKKNYEFLKLRVHEVGKHLSKSVCCYTNIAKKKFSVFLISSAGNLAINTYRIMLGYSSSNNKPFTVFSSSVHRTYISSLLKISFITQWSEKTKHQNRQQNKKEIMRIQRINKTTYRRSYSITIYEKQQIQHENVNFIGIIA